MTLVPGADSRWKLAGKDVARSLGRARAWIGEGLRPGSARRVALWTLSLLAMAVAAAVLWLYFLDWNTMRGPVARYASARLGRPIRIDGNLDVHLFSLTPSLSASGVVVGNPAWAGPHDAAAIGRLAFSIRLLPWLFGDTILPYLEFDRPDVVILRRADGTTNWDSGSGGRAWDIPPIQRLTISNGHVLIDDRVRKLVFTGTVSSQEVESASGSAFQLSGDGTLNGKAFAARAWGGPLIHVDASRPYHFKADVHAGTTEILADGAITQPFHLDRFETATTISGANLSDLYDLTGLAMPQTASYRIHGTLSRDRALYRFADFSGVVGSSDLGGTLAIDTAGAKAFITGTVASKVLDFKDLGHLFGGKSAQAVATGRLLPDVPLHLDRLRQMDADVDYSAETIRSQDFPLRGVHAHIALRNSVLLLKPLAFQFAYGRLSGSLRIDAGKDIPLTSVDARITDVKIAQFLSAPPAASGLLEAHAQLQGSGSSVQKVAASASGPVTLVVPRGSFNAKLAEFTGIDLLNALFLAGRGNTNLRCAVAHLDTRNGVMTASRLVIDTDPVRIEGTGSIDLANETVALTIAGKPKEFRIGRLHAPITFNGPLAHPAIGLKAGPLVAQGGIAVLLGLVFPPAAILPFVDPGLAKDANCISLLDSAKAAGAPVKRAQIHR
jgi:uncharacterized protein involved in outer membrane biogenesis